ncbi:MAG: MmcQ/YjbR family DNA-binding protein [Gammaproteobacteria bacterium]
MRPNAHPQVPREILTQLRATCLELPEASEEQAWVGMRWTIRKKNFAHVLMIDAGWPPAYARAAGTDGPACVLTFRSQGREFEPTSFGHAPYFRPVWFPNIVGMVLDAGADWDKVAGYLIVSYRVLAPQKLIERIDVPLG